MKIDDNSQSVVVELSRLQRVEQHAVEGDAKGAEPASKSLKSVDKVNISQSAERFNKTSNTLKGASDFSADKVNELKSKIEAGAYQVSSKDVAEKMLAALSKENDR
ncbi:flagellar biosynthesis anti-sigma factor FlgM [Geotalea uraniireducens]|uniref:Negative regulator of flagellin synthesis n=1 Tax=Geotalea uraniireducens (strain Rf4) TaxID=351605 RepID=A5G664_GEOUR|nr:flagellar biosynthesis anti-sigma factor FlgM [Geotalea uraniireducens]ABQ27282.1 hypothetical protein Gura_3121 [Geotalea uraniireducens Rf4]